MDKVKAVSIDHYDNCYVVQLYVLDKFKVVGEFPDTPTKLRWKLFKPLRQFEHTRRPHTNAYIDAENWARSYAAEHEAWCLQGLFDGVSLSFSMREFFDGATLIS